MRKPQLRTMDADPIRLAVSACQRHFWNAGIFSAFQNILYLAPTLYMLQVYDRVVPTHGGVTLAMLTVIFVFAVVTITGLDLVRTRLLLRAGIRLDRLLSGPIIDALMRVSKVNGARSAAVLREFDTFRQTMTGPGILALFDAPWAPIYILVCFFLHWALGTMALVSALILALMSWLNERGTSGPIKEANIASQQAYSGIDTSLASAGTISALGMRSAMVRRHLRERYRASVVTVKVGFTSANYVSWVKGIRLLLQSLALGLGAFLAIEQQISAGAIFAASLLVSRALAPIEMINGAWKNIIQSRAAYTSLIELFNVRGELREHTALPTPKGEVSVENLGVTMPGLNRPLISGVTFALEPGEMLGIIGPSGAGKSTLVKALVGVLPAYAGAVRIDGANLLDWPEEQIADALGYAPQESTLYRGTIKENIARFRTEFVEPHELDEQVVAAAQICGAHEFILRLPQAYDTELGPHGGGLSVGQAQRISLARALFGTPSVVIMDEPNASLDAEGEAQLNRAVGLLRERGATVIVVAHRTGILTTVDKLLFMRDGRMELFGARQQVLERLGAPPAAPLQKPAQAAE